MQELVSVIVPVYNVEQYLPQCIESILIQSYRNIEIILVDDGSTDSSGRICEKYAKKDARIQVIHQENGGAAAARNHGIDRAKGAFIYTCDSDDYLIGTAIEKMLVTIKKNNSDFIFFNAYTFDDVPTLDKGSYQRKAQYMNNTGEKMAYLELINDEYKPGSPLAFYKRSFLMDHNIRFYEGIMCEDELFSFYTYNEAQSVSYCPEALYYRRIHSDSVMTSNSNTIKKFQGCYTVFNSMLEYCRKNERFTRTNREFLIRMGKSSLLAYRQLNELDKSSCIAEYAILRRQINQYQGFGDFSMLVRLYNWKLGVFLSGIRKYGLMVRYGTK